MKAFTRLALLCAAMLITLPLQAQTLKIATIVPEGSEWMKSMREGAEAIHKRTDGRVSLKIYGGGVQGNDKQVQRKMRTGQLHGGAFTSGAMSMFQQDADIYSLGLIFRNTDEVQYVRKHLDNVLIERLYEAGYVCFGFAGGGFAYMMSNTPLRNTADMSGQKVWTPEGDALAYAALQAIGVAPVSMPITDVMTGLQTDLLDSVAVPPVGAVVLQWHTRLKYITDVPLAYVYAGILIDRKAFERMQPGDQAVVREVLGEVYQGFEESGSADNLAALQALQDSGLELVSPDPAESEAWRKAVVASQKQLADKGEFDPALFEKIQQLLAEYR
ncbi:MAG TPA: TRAP transporter substrate-binding protein DctP, partial [Xanthomonadales bacterium]|nr:TRAP transporter substrate-binding protein DctP [Xanthomonadales bacterium]